jgi:hypothetical protein
VKFDNVLVTSGQGDTQMLLVDWELCGLGEPAWDLAGVVDGLLLPSVHEGRVDWDRTLIGQVAEPAVTAHRATAGASLSPSSDELVAAVVVRLAQGAVQLAAMSHEDRGSSTTADQALRCARTLANDLLGVT